MITEDSPGAFWERVPEEPVTAYKAFYVYRDMGTTRSLRKAAAPQRRSVLGRSLRSPYLELKIRGRGPLAASTREGWILRGPTFALLRGENLYPRFKVAMLQAKRRQKEYR